MLERFFRIPDTCLWQQKPGNMAQADCIEAENEDLGCRSDVIKGIFPSCPTVAAVDQGRMQQAAQGERHSSHKGEHPTYVTGKRKQKNGLNKLAKIRQKRQ